MKKSKLIFVLCLIPFIKGISQDVSYDIELSQPNSKGILNIDVYSASITVIGTEDNFVQLDIIDERKGKDKKFGAAEFLYQIHENNNIVSITNRNGLKRKIRGLKLQLKVPKDFSLKLETYFGEKIMVSKVLGQIEVEGFFTDLYFEKIQNNIVANTNKGSLKAYFSDILEDGISYLSNYEGNVDIYFPKDPQATVFIDNYFGTYKSDFKLSLGTSDDKAYKKFVKRLINGGGGDFYIVNYYGDIFLKRHPK